MQFIGRIVRLQVQQSSLKIGEPRRFDPAPILSVPRITVDPSGVVGYPEDGEAVRDIHNRTHPASKNIRGVNGISFGFTSHYAAMRSRFGPHLIDGIAGENVLIGSDQRYDLAAVSDGVFIQSDDGGMTRLQRILIAEPCLEFSRYAERLPTTAPPDGDVKEALQFLRFGMRGFYASLEGGPSTLRLGDLVYHTVR